MPRPKQLIFEQLATVGSALAGPARLELLDALVHAERGVEELAAGCGLSVANASHHLRQLHQAGLVTRRRSGKQVLYTLAGPHVLALLQALSTVAETGLAEIDRLLRQYYTRPGQFEPVTRDDLQARLADGSVVVLDVRDAAEYAAGHIPGAANIPLGELERRLAEIDDGAQIVACCRGLYCLYSYQALDILYAHGIPARRLEGGFFDWLAAGLPTESQGHQLTTVKGIRS